jgi:hypothetical protein
MRKLTQVKSPSVVVFVLKLLLRLIAYVIICEFTPKKRNMSVQSATNHSGS